MIKDIISKNLTEAVNLALKNNELANIPDDEIQKLAIEIPKNTEFGDYAVNISGFAKFTKMPPIKIAQIISKYIKMDDAQINVVAGFINFKLGSNYLNNTIKKILEQKNDYGKITFGNHEKVNLEYISANPTGPFHIGHGRWAAMGSSLANLMEFAGYDIHQEFYINDAGNQINNLGKSLWIRVLQELGKKADFPKTEEEGAKNYYPGEYLIETAKKYLENNKEQAEKSYKLFPDALNPSDEIINEMSVFAKKEMLKKQKQLLDNFRVKFDCFYSETSLHESGEVEKTFNFLKERGEIYEKDDAQWFASSKYGDDQDRVIKKSDGSNTYLTADIAYHHDKIKRGFDRLINIWGADHHGYVPRMKAALAALGHNPDRLEVLLGQLVNIIIDGEQVRMGKRKKMLTLEELIEDVGVDATRFWMIIRSIDTTLDFDVNLAKSCSDENPVYYVQYAHARACSILRNATSERFDQETKKELAPFIESEKFNSLINSEKFDLNNLSSLWKKSDENASKATKTLILKLESFEDLILNSAKNRAPYMIARYVQELASDFHHFYAYSRVLNVEDNLMIARLSIVQAVKQVISNALNILGVSSPEFM
ncbi:MAG: arginine--tRNA ligase [Candidatus Gastranaerophilales bacterium]|nr:arginine--tRNA ligase [Candidatus Gastranaerophilales bacterium]